MSRSNDAAATTIESAGLRGAGLRLAADVAGPEQGPKILFLHGSGQTRQSWGDALRQAGARGYRAWALDLRGHGDSDWSPDGAYSLELFAADLREVLPQIGPDAIVVGASLGGLAALLVAAAAPQLLRALVLVDITPRVELEGAKEVVAFMNSAPGGFASLEEAAAAVAAYLPHRRRPSSSEGLRRNLRLRNGRWHWHWDPAFMRMGRDAGERAGREGGKVLEDAARALRLPTLLIRGGRSRVVSEQGTREFLELAPHAEFVDIAGAHHMVVGDANDAFNEAVFGFAAKLSS
jgi:pimeloyl-ACP methyl ester carboxylesterase